MLRPACFGKGRESKSLPNRGQKKEKQSHPVKQKWLDAIKASPLDLEFIKTRFLVQNVFGFVEDGMRFLGRIADGGEAQPSRAAKSAEHMENNPCLPDLPEVEAAPNDEIEDIIRRESSIARRFEMIAGDEKFSAPVRRDEGGAFRIVNASGQKLQSQERMSGSTFPQIDLDGVGFPSGGIVRPGDDEIDRETTDYAGVSQKASNFGSVMGDRARISRVGWK